MKKKYLSLIMGLILTVASVIPTGIVTAEEAPVVADVSSVVDGAPVTMEEVPAAAAEVSPAAEDTLAGDMDAEVSLGEIPDIEEAGMEEAQDNAGETYGDAILENDEFVEEIVLDENLIEHDMDNSDTAAAQMNIEGSPISIENVEITSDAEAVQASAGAEDEDVHYFLKFKKDGEYFEEWEGINLLCGGSVTIDTELWQDVDDEEERADTQYTLQLSETEGDEQAATATVNGTQIMLTGVSVDDYILRVQAMVDNVTVGEVSYIDVLVTEGYYELTAELPEDPIGLGKELSLTPGLNRCTLENSAVTKTPVTEIDGQDIKFVWDYYDGEHWHVKAGTENNNPPTLIRDYGWNTYLTLHAVLADDYETQGLLASVACRRFAFAKLDFSTFGFENGIEAKSMFQGDEPLTLSVTGVPEGEAYHVVYVINEYDDEGNLLPENEMTVTKTVNANSCTFALSGKDIPEYGSSIDVCAYLCYGEVENPEWGCLASDYLALSIYRDRCYILPFSMNIILGSSVGYRRKSGAGYPVEVWVRDDNGAQSSLTVSVPIEGFKSKDENIVKVEEEPLDDGTTLLEFIPVGVGEADITISVEDSTDSRIKLTDAPYCHVTVKEEDYEFAGSIRTMGGRGDGQMLPSDTLQIICPGVNHSYFVPNAEGGYAEWEQLDVNAYDLSYTGYDTSLIKVSPDGVVTALPGVYGDTEITVVLTLRSNPGVSVRMRQLVYIYVTDSYEAIDVPDPIFLDEKGKAEIPLTTKRYSLEHPDGVVVDGVDYEVNCYGSEDTQATIEGNKLSVSLNGELPEYGYNMFSLTIRASKETDDDYVYAYAYPMVIYCRHEMATETKQPTCTQNGFSRGKCNKCGYVQQQTSIPATGHSFGGWKTVSPATTEAPERQQRTCTVCGAVEEQTVGEKLTPGAGSPSTPSTETPSTEATGTGSTQTPGTEAGTGSGTGAVQAPFIELNATSIPLKLKQSTGVVKVKMAEGDSIVSWTSSNKKVVTVNGKGKLKAKKKGKATITVTLASGKTASFVVKVQKNKVTTKKVSGVEKKLTLAKGKKYKLEPVLKPLTSQDKITYTSSNKKVAVVDKKGNITAKGTGTAKITVKSGKKKAVCTVTVK